MNVNREWAEQRAEASETRLTLLRPSMVEGAPKVLRVTVAEAELLRRGTMGRIAFRDFPGCGIFAKGRDLVNAADQLGDDASEWRGRLLTLEWVRRSFNGQTFDKYVPAPADKAREHAQRGHGAALPSRPVAPERDTVPAPLRRLRGRR